MSFSFTVRAETKAAAKAKVAQEMEKAAAAQSCHQRDKYAAVAAANAFVDQLSDDATKDVAVSVSGSLTGRWEGSDVTHCESANLSVSAHLATRIQQPA